MGSLLLAVLMLAGSVALLVSLREAIQRWRLWRRRVLWEDALKQICSAEQDGRSLTCAELGGRLERRPRLVVGLVQELERADLLRCHEGVLELTDAGRHMGMRVLRGHRLWERYLADEGQVSLDRVHAASERAEHLLREDDLDALADHLGHPRTDPHGDPIPGRTGRVLRQQRVPLTDWPSGEAVVVVHIEDEPPQALAEALRAGLRPGTGLRVVQRDATSIVYETEEGRFALAPALAAQVHVRRAAAGEGLAKPHATLAELALGKEADVVALAEDCKGLRRRRLLDLGFTPGARVEAVLASVGDSAHAYRIRGTLVALRREQAAQVLIERERVRAGERAALQR